MSKIRKQGNANMIMKNHIGQDLWTPTVADPGGGAEGAMAPPGPVKIGHKKDGHQRRPHRFPVSRPPPYPAAGSATDPPGERRT